MKKQVKLDDIYAISGDIVVRQVKSKIIIINIIIVALFSFIVAYFLHIILLMFLL